MVKSLGRKASQLCKVKPGMQSPTEEVSVVDQSFEELHILKDCAKRKDLTRGTEAHAKLLRKGLLGENRHFANSLVAMYANCGAFAKAQQILEELSGRDVVSWSALIAGYARHGLGDEALKCFDEMQREGISPNAVTFISLLKACGSVKALDKGKLLHSEIVREGLLETNFRLCIALVHMYAKCGAVAKAQEVHDEFPFWSVVSWSALISGYAENGRSKEALHCFERMKSEGFSPNEVTFVCVLKACGSVQLVEKGEEIHADIVRQGLENHIILGNALLDMYVKCGALDKAEQFVHKLPMRDVITWSVLIAGFAQHGYGEEAIAFFEQMQGDGLCPNTITLLCILKACGNTGTTDKGIMVHDALARLGLSRDDVVVGTALADMYAKSGALEKAQQVLDELHVRNVVSWSVLIAGYAQHGHGDAAMICFERMQGEGHSPDAVVFSCMLNACCHSGLLVEGQMCFENMRSKFGITPDVSHLSCMIDLFGRSGHFDKAIFVVKSISGYSSLAWDALLATCNRWGNVSLGRLAFEHAVQHNESHSESYVSMSNICVAAGMHENQTVSVP